MQHTKIKNTTNSDNRILLKAHCEAMAPKRISAAKQLVRAVCVCLRQVCYQQFAGQVDEVEQARAEFRSLPREKQELLPVSSKCFA